MAVYRGPTRAAPLGVVITGGGIADQDTYPNSYSVSGNLVNGPLEGYVPDHDTTYPVARTLSVYSWATQNGEVQFDGSFPGKRLTVAMVAKPWSDDVFDPADTYGDQTEGFFVFTSPRWVGGWIPPVGYPTTPYQRYWTDFHHDPHEQEYIDDPTICGWEIIDRCKWLDQTRAPVGDWDTWHNGPEYAKWNAYAVDHTDLRAYSDTTHSTYSIGNYGTATWVKGTDTESIAQYPVGQPFWRVLEEGELEFALLDSGGDWKWYFGPGGLYLTGTTFPGPPNDPIDEDNVSTTTELSPITWHADGSARALIFGWTVAALTQPLETGMHATAARVSVGSGGSQVIATLTTTTQWRWLYTTQTTVTPHLSGGPRDKFTRFARKA